MISLDDIDLVELAVRLSNLGHGLPPPVKGAAAGAQTPALYQGTATPTFAASPGSVYLKSAAASSAIYVNQSAANPGTTWNAITIP